MLRGLLSCWVVSCALACSSSTTNESGSGGSSTGGSSTGGSSTGGSSTGGSSTGGSAGSSGSGGSGGSMSGGAGGQSSGCSWVGCGVALKTSACDGAYNACKVTTCDAEVAAYVQCVCSGKKDCLLPAGPAAINLINCLAKDTTLSPKCFGFQCVAPGGSCSPTGIGEHCCEGTNCVSGQCV